jgi:hypothetical protein
MIARFVQSVSADVQANRVYIEEDPSVYTLDLTPVGEITPPVVDPDGYSRVDLAGLANASPRDFDGTYDIYITALDERGNESGPLEIADAAFDLVPPDAPTDGAIES